MNLRDPVGGGAKIAAAGPLSNFFVAAVFGILIRLLAAGGNAESPLVLLFSLIVLRNIALGVFNLLPIPPLDGSKVLFAILPRTPAGNQIAVFLEQYGFMLLLFFVFSGFTSVLSPAIIYIFEALVGRGL
jgi:Zn-dependent protease